MAAGMLVGMTLQPMWGMIADKFGRIRLLLGLAFVTPVCFFFLFNSRIFFVLFIVNILYFLVRTPQSSVSDAYVLRATEKLGQVYGTIRYFQSIGFGVGGYIAGFYLGKYAVTNLWLLAASISLIGALVVGWLPKSETEQRVLVRGELFHNVKMLVSWQNKNFLIFLLGAFFLNQTLAAFNTYLVIAYSDLGGQMKYVGWAFLIASAANIPSMHFARHLTAKFGIVETMIFSSLVYLFRWVILWFVTNPMWMIGIQVLHGSFGLFYVPAVHYVVENSPAQIRATAQTIFGMIAGGLAGIVGNLLNGILIQSGGPSLMYAVCAGSVVLSLGCFGYLVVSTRRQSALEKTPTASM